MKNKILRLALPVLALVMMLTLASCKNDDNPSIIGTSTADTTTEAPVTTPAGTTTEHVHAYKETVVPATCTKAGYTLHLCDCGDQYTDTPTEMIAHTFGEWETTTKPTCTAEGVQTHKCTVCGATETQKVAAAGHKYIDSVVKPTKTTQGYTVHTCAVCNASHSDTYTNATGSVGLEYSQNSDGSLTITGTGTCTDTEIIIYSTNSDGKNVTAIAAGAFAGNKVVKSISLPKSIVSIGDGAFAGCTALNSITVEAENANFTATNDVLYTKDGKTIVAFPVGKALTEFTIPAAVTDIRPSAFAGCVNLTQFKLADTSSKLFEVDENGVLYKKTGDDGKATQLIAYPIGKVQPDFTVKDSIVTIGDYAFYGAKNLKTVAFNSSLAVIGAHAFDGCTALEAVDMPNSVVKLGDSAFANCSAIKTLTISKGLDTIGAHAFENCANIVTVTIPESVLTIGEYAFYNCDKMESVVIGSKVSTIGENAFCNINNMSGAVLKSVYYKGASYQVEWSRINIHSSNLVPLTITAKLYCYSETAKAGAWYENNGVPTLW